MGTLIISTDAEIDRSTYTAKCIDKLAELEATQIDELNNVYGFASSPPNFKGLSLPFVVHTPVDYNADRRGSQDIWGRRLRVASVVVCVDLSQMRSMQYPSAFEKWQIFGDVWFELLGGGQTAHENRIWLCDQTGSDDVIFFRAQYGTLGVVGIDGYLGWYITIDFSQEIVR